MLFVAEEPALSELRVSTRGSRTGPERVARTTEPALRTRVQRGEGREAEPREPQGALALARTALWAGILFVILSATCFVDEEPALSELRVSTRGS